ncbi:MAG: hypothetical protein ACOCUU_00690 [Nanoarchaeota archaeon]
MADKIIAIRIAGKIKLRGFIKETLIRLRLKNKYNCIVFSKDNKELEDMVINAKDAVAFGELDPETEKKLEKERGNTKKQNKKKTITTYRLHPPRKGIDSKSHFPKGVLGNHGKEINKLVERML